MKLSIGILAHNEEKNIATTLRSLLAQSLLACRLPNISQVEVIVVPNASTDKTATIAEEVLSESIPSHCAPAVCYRVEALKEPGKSNAWNQFVHRLSAPDADFLVLMDADIQFYEQDVLLKMFDSLLAHPDKWANTGYPLKSAVLKKNKNLLELISLEISKQSKVRFPQICGQLYMARADKLRQLALPVGFSGTDGFIAELICTNFFTQEYNASKMMLLLETPSHTFEAYTSPLSFIKHERQLTKAIMGHQWMYKHLQAIKEQSDQPLGEYIRTRNENEPDWVSSVYRANTYKADQGWTWFIPAWLFFRRFKLFRNKSIIKRVILAPAVLFASVIDWFVFVLANHDLNRKAYQSYWR
jgi:glycosyltransferase involved in cell wall biosynthesis